jgi:DNA-binding transcriptional LysR family regulator
MNIRNIDLNLLVYLSVLLDEKSVSRAANKLALTQPTVSAALKRLREHFSDPLLVRTAGGMQPTEKALSLVPQLSEFIRISEAITQSQTTFDATKTVHTFKILTNDYIESCLLFPFIAATSDIYPNIHYDISSPGDFTLPELQDGSIDLAINGFKKVPSSFHQKRLWRDNFRVVCHKNNPFADQPDLDHYLKGQHIWMSRNGNNSENRLSINSHPSKLGWIDEALWQLEKRRNIHVFTRHFQALPLIVNSNNLLLSIPNRLALAGFQHPQLVTLPIPFQIVPEEVSMLWSPIKHYDPAHIWLRNKLGQFASTVPS